VFKYDPAFDPPAPVVFGIESHVEQPGTERCTETFYLTLARLTVSVAVLCILTFSSDYYFWLLMRFKEVRRIVNELATNITNALAR